MKLKYIDYIAFLGKGNERESVDLHELTGKMLGGSYALRWRWFVSGDREQLVDSDLTTGSIKPD